RDGETRIVFDRFHIMRDMTKAVDTVRKQEHRDFLRTGEDSPLTGTKYVWLYSDERRPEYHAEAFATLQALNLKVGRAWAIKEALRTLWTYRQFAAVIHPKSRPEYISRIKKSHALRRVPSRSKRTSKKSTSARSPARYVSGTNTSRRRRLHSATVSLTSVTPTRGPSPTSSSCSGVAELLLAAGPLRRLGEQRLDPWADFLPHRPPPRRRLFPARNGFLNVFANGDA